MTQGELEVAVDAHADTGEGPVWDASRQTLVWVDITGRLVHEYDPHTGTDVSFPVPLPVGTVGLRQQGGLVLALEDGFWLCEPGVTNLRRLAAVEEDRPKNRMNDGKPDSRGRFWAGTMRYDDARYEAALYRLEPGGKVETMVSQVSLSNGIGWSLDDRLMYYVDTLAHTLDVFDFEAGAGRISNRRTLVAVPASEGSPDGLCVDAEGFIWLAVWGSGQVRRCSPDGTLDRVLRLPVTQVTCPTFGGPDLLDLYITSAAGGLDADQRRAQPHAGALFRLRPGVGGTEPFRFAG
jgi:sugar lactone lactonase YvrE